MSRKLIAVAVLAAAAVTLASVALVTDRAGLDPFRVAEEVSSDLDSIDPKEET